MLQPGYSEHWAGPQPEAGDLGSLSANKLNAHIAPRGPRVETLQSSCPPVAWALCSDPRGSQAPWKGPATLGLEGRPPLLSSSRWEPVAGPNRRHHLSPVGPVAVPDSKHC